MDKKKDGTLADSLHVHGLTARPHSGADLAVEDSEEVVIAGARRLQRAPRAPQIVKTRAQRPDVAQLYIVPSITPGTFRLGIQNTLSRSSLARSMAVWCGRGHVSRESRCRITRRSAAGNRGRDGR